MEKEAIVQHIHRLFLMVYSVQKRRDGVLGLSRTGADHRRGQSKDECQETTHCCSTVDFPLVLAQLETEFRSSLDVWTLRRANPAENVAAFDLSPLLADWTPDRSRVVSTNSASI